MKQDELDAKLKFANKHEISNYMRVYVILPFAESHSLDLKVAFSLLDEYFSISPGKLLYFINLQNYIDDIQQSMRQI